MFVVLIVVLIAAALIWWLIFETEGVYLGRRVVIALYDLYAGRYDNIKQNGDVDEHLHVAQPIMTLLHPQTDPLVLDVATGTGRLPLALCQHARFDGHVIGVDLSRRMLRRAARTLSAGHFEDYVSLIWGTGERLPFDDGAFDLVTCMEALEFMPDPVAALGECVRVLRPGGVLFITNRNNNLLMPGRLWSQADLQALLQQNGIEAVAMRQWQVDYMLAWGRKTGTSDGVGVRPLSDVLRCPRCPDRDMIEQDSYWVCAGCAGRADIGPDGILHLFPLQV